MKIEQAYVNFVNLVNRNATNNNLNVDKARFIILFRSVQLQYLDYLLDNRVDDTLRRASHLLVYKKPLLTKSTESDRDSYFLPEDFFDFSNLHVEASKGKCKKVNLSTREVKTEDLEEILSDDFSKPSFEYRETVYFSSDRSTITVLKDDFSLDNAYITYYRQPAQVDIEGYIHIDGTPSTSVDPDWDDVEIEKILLAMSKEFAGINNDTNQYQLSKDRLFNFKQ